MVIEFGTAVYRFATLRPKVDARSLDQDQDPHTLTQDLHIESTSLVIVDTC